MQIGKWCFRLERPAQRAGIYPTQMWGFYARESVLSRQVAVLVVIVATSQPHRTANVRKSCVSRWEHNHSPGKCVQQ